MNLRGEEELPPLTPDQQAETLRLAARLQAEHQAQTSSEALLRAATEAGIDAKFVIAAAHQVAGKKRRRGSKPVPRPLAATLILATMNALAIFWEPSSSVGVDLSGGELAILVGAAFFAALNVAKERRVRWTVPAAIAPLWLALALPYGAWSLVHAGQAPSWLAPLATIVGSLQIVAALVGALVGGYRPTLVRVDRPQSPLG